MTSFDMRAIGIVGGLRCQSPLLFCAVTVVVEAINENMVLYQVESKIK